MKVDFKQQLEPADLVALFAAAVGQEKSVESVNAAIHTLRLPPGEYSVEEAIRIVSEIGRGGGLLGIVARLAGARLQAGQAFRSASIPPR